MSPLSIWLFVSAVYYTHLHGIVSLLILTIIYIQAVTSHTDTQGRFSDHTVHSLYMIMVMETSTIGVWKWEVLYLERESN